VALGGFLERAPHEALMYSQYQQDQWVLAQLGGQRGGFFLDSGAADGELASNTLLLESVYGWTGICVEPNTEFFAQLRRNRRCLCVNCCLYDREGVVEFVESAYPLGGILDAYDPRVLAQAKRNFSVPEDATGKPATVQKQARTVRSVLDACAAPPVIDYWSLDTEGSELAILQSFPFDRYAFRILTVEHNHGPARGAIRGLLESRGYVYAAAFGVDDCYVNPDLLRHSAFRSQVWRRRRQ
jgi:FkbM family methyltransferase